MAEASSPNLESLVALWPVASNLSEHLPVGDLIALSRLSATLRALLHGFAIPEDRHPSASADSVRGGLYVGQHGTPYWQQLKSRASIDCSSPTHTKGSDPRPCRYCSKPICAACIVRSSFARGHENTFQNRTRYLCRKCWETGNTSQGERFELRPSQDLMQRRQWYDPKGSTRDFCTCTLKEDGWICIDCKDLQNWDAVSSAETRCHGKECGQALDADRERRRICLWCNKALPRQIGGTTRHHWNQKMIEARARNAASRQADLGEYNRRRQKLMRMSRRELRGDEAVQDDPDADLPQFVRHLDTINYRSYMSESAAPSGDNIYDSKRGYWRYGREFLLNTGARCAHAPPPLQLATFKQKSDGALSFARTNLEKSEDIFSFTALVPSMTKARLTEWCSLKAVVLELLLVQKLSYDATMQTMEEEYGFHASIKEYRKVLQLWYGQGQIGERRRGSPFEREEDHPETLGRVPSDDGSGLSRIPTLEGDFASLINKMHRRRTNPTTTIIPSDVEESRPNDPWKPVGDLNQKHESDDSQDRLTQKLEQDRNSFALERDVVVVSDADLSPPPPIDSPEVSDPPPPPPPECQSQSHPPGRQGAATAPTSAPQTEEDPPPYTPDGWIWS